MPWEAEKFFSQPGMARKNFTLDWWPLGSGPYMLTENDPNARIVLERNPNFRGEPYPSQGEPGDAAAGLLADAGRSMPFIERAVYSREKESIPNWNKFLQGYYDSSGIGSDNFDQAVRVSAGGEAALTPEMQRRGIELRTSVATSLLYIGFNWLDPVVGGAQGGEAAARARKLRQAISIAVDMEEFLSIFANGRGIVASGPLPPGIFGWRGGAEGVNPVTHVWRDGAPRRRSLDEAKRLLAEAGYPDGRDAKSGQPLVLYLDTVGRGPGDKARLDWWRKQLAKLSIQLEVRETDWNRFQEKLRKGSEQLFILGWNADYPDPENFMFLLDGAQARAKGHGENAANYENPEFDALYARMKNMQQLARAAADHRPHGRDRAQRRAVDLGLRAQGLPAVPQLAGQRQAQRHGAQQPEVPAPRPRAARGAAARVEPPGAVAAGARARAAGGGRAAGRARLPQARAHGGAPGELRCWPTSSAGCCTRSRS